MGEFETVMQTQDEARTRNHESLFCKKDAFQNTGFSRLKCQVKRKQNDTACF